VKLLIYTVYRIDDGKISWNADYWDTGDLQRQLTDEKKAREKKKVKKISRP